MRDKEEEKIINRMMRDFFFLTNEPWHIRIFGYIVQLTLLAATVFILKMLAEKI